MRQSILIQRGPLWGASLPLLQGKGVRQREFHVLSQRRRPLEAATIPRQSTRSFPRIKFFARKFVSKPPVVSEETKNSRLFSMKHLQEGPSLILGTGKLANLTKASVVAAMGDTVVLMTVATGDDRANQSIQNFTVEYKQRHHGVGKIPLTTGSRRDNARSTPLETLGSRAIDRALRPLIDDTDNTSIHVHASVQGLSPWGGNPIVLSINAASAALMTHGMLKEPVAAVSLGVVAGDANHPKVLVNATPKHVTGDAPSLACELLYAGTRTKAVMAELQYHQTVSANGGVQTSIPEEELSQLLALAHAAIQPLLDTQAEFIKEQNKANALVTIDDLLEENELRASLGLPPLSKSGRPDNASRDRETGIDLHEMNEDLLDKAYRMCEEQLEHVCWALFGFSKGVARTANVSDYRTAYIHPGNASTNLLPKSVRGKREQIVYNEVQRLIMEWIKAENKLTPEHSNDAKTLASLLTTKVHKKLLQNALCTTAIRHGTRADQRLGGTPPDPANGFKTIRPISVTVPALPDVCHGSAIFARGETQVLCTTTLGAPREGIPIRDPFDSLLMQPASNMASLKHLSEKEKPEEGGDGTSFEDLPVGSLRYLRTQEAIESDLNTRKSKADREMTGESGNLWEHRRAFLQYDFPSFSTGELPTGSSHHNRRAIGKDYAAAPMPMAPHSVLSYPKSLNLAVALTRPRSFG